VVLVDAATEQVVRVSRSCRHRLGSRSPARNTAASALTRTGSPGSRLVSRRREASDAGTRVSVELERSEEAFPPPGLNLRAIVGNSEIARSRSLLNSSEPPASLPRATLILPKPWCQGLPPRKVCARSSAGFDGGIGLGASPPTRRSIRSPISVFRIETTVPESRARQRNDRLRHLRVIWLAPTPYPAASMSQFDR
jgi:hypothetical protein